MVENEIQRPSSDLAVHEDSVDVKPRLLNALNVNTKDA